MTTKAKGGRYGDISMIWKLFGPNRNGGGAFLDRPLILAAWDDGVAVGFGVFPARAKARGVKFPSAGAFLASLSTLMIADKGL